LNGPAHRTRIERVVLVVADLEQAERDYVGTLGFTVENRETVGPELIQALRLHGRHGRHPLLPRGRFGLRSAVPPGAGGRRSSLRLGREHVDLVEFARTGRRYPTGSTSTDLWFQHFAIVVDDMEDAYRRVTASDRFRPISRSGPIQLPVASGGVVAFKFRDSDGHPLELLAFTEGRSRDSWRGRPASGPFLGIDHTAMSVADMDTSLGFYSAVLGLSARTCNENGGREQGSLDDVDDVSVRVAQLEPELDAPRLQLLHYRAGSRRPIPRDTASNDIAATHCELRVKALDPLLGALDERGEPVAPEHLVRHRDGTRSTLITSPDGHRILVREDATA
jgi:catechol 2,3-dioxygenase-like lactoylglutathione lyase family enzyme